ncbi:general secretion pathway protein N [Natronospira proteinivora]|uniref:Type II secretion system protein N n=1 Tax=Natronospira proteinivora TaxID=1807133 RepID=A0ABT1G9B2_9GAMM|nr:type II secretion system protein N [Natronospira proteinivora]MCP1726878.1 general secretion pathway protein N [Natronospira proteinivora]
MKRILLFSTVGMIAFLVFFMAKAPAALVLYLVPDREELVLMAPSGTLWNGRMGQVQAGPLRLGPLEWDIRLGRLLMLRLDAQVDTRLDDGRISGRVILRPGGRIQIPQLQGQDLPLSRLAPLASQEAGMVDGTAAFQLSEFEFREMRPWSGEGQLRVFDLSANLAGQVELGSYGGQITGTEGRFELDFTDAGEATPFALAGILNYQSEEQRYEVDGRIRARPEAPSNIAQGLQYLGQEDEEGYYPIRFSGRL